MPDHATLLDRARAGDEDAFAELTGPHRRELHVHCYRMLGSFEDADDAVQDTLLAAWRGLAGFQARASVRTWLYRVATNTCLNQIRAASRRPQMTEPPSLTAPRRSPGCSPTRTRCSTPSPTQLPARTPASSSRRRFPSPSSPP